MHLLSLNLLCPMVKEKMHLQESIFFGIDLGVNFTGSVDKYPLHHATYAPAKFEIATSNSLGGDAF